MTPSPPQRRARPAGVALAVAAGAAMLLWPALLNGYPILFSDTGAFLAQTLRPLMIWDKPYLYGPFLHLFHWRVTLWAPLLAQGLILSHLLWLTQRAVRGPAAASAAWHLGLTAGLAALTTAPWSAATLMPDIFAPVAVLCLFLLGLVRERLSRGEAWYLAVLATFAIAAHLAHLIIAAAVIALIALVALLAPRGTRSAAVPGAAAPGDTRGAAPDAAAPPPFGTPAATVPGSVASNGALAAAVPAHTAAPDGTPAAASRAVAPYGARSAAAAAVLRAAAPLGAALAVLVATNWVGHGRVAVSPYGATFLLARLQADGPAARTVQALCPGAGWYLCASAGRLPMDSDEFLWDRDSPVNREPDGRPIFLGGVRIAPEARAILRETIAREPLGVAAAMLRNTLRQLVTARVGDTLGAAHLRVGLRPELAGFFSAREVAAYDAALQARGALPARAAPFLWPHMPVLLAALPLLGLALWRAAREGWRRQAAAAALPALGLLLCVLAGMLANAFATGALSGPHDRYQARIAWLLPFAAALALAATVPQRPPPPPRSAPIRGPTHAPAERRTESVGKRFPFV